MTTTVKTIIILSNYSHDIATAFLFISATALYLLSKTQPLTGEPEEKKSFLVLFKRFTLMAKVSLGWVLLAGVPRVIFYKQLEWSQMAGQLQVIAIIIKHIFMFVLVGTGILHWHKLAKKAKELNRY